jgi:hypothetical protein
MSTTTQSGTRAHSPPGGDPAPAQEVPGARPARQFRPSRGRRMGEAIMRVLVRAGLVDKDAPVEDFVAEADRHPVFELLPVNG